MPVLRIPTPWRVYTDGRVELTLDGSTAGAMMATLVQIYPALRPHLFNPQGELRPYVNLFLNGENLKSRQGLDTPLDADDRLLLVPAVAGG
jgi:molybdopterin converting factor small subunit